jgi:hypothetical protein
MTAPLVFGLVRGVERNTGIGSRGENGKVLIAVLELGHLDDVDLVLRDALISAGNELALVPVVDFLAPGELCYLVTTA